MKKPATLTLLIVLYKCASIVNFFKYIRQRQPKFVVQGLNDVLKSRTRYERSRLKEVFMFVFVCRSVVYMETGDETED